MAEINIHNLCRICLKGSDFHSDIYNERLGDGSLIMELINDLLQLDVELDDGLPNFLCSNCYNKMADFELFKRFAHECRAVLQCIEENTSLSRTQEEGTSCDDRVQEFLGNPTEIFLVPTKMEEFDECISADKDPLMEESSSETSDSSSGDDKTFCLESSSNEPFDRYGDKKILNEASCSFDPLEKHSNSAKSLGRNSILKETIHSKSQESTFLYKGNPVLSENLESGKIFSECDLLDSSSNNAHILERHKEMDKSVNAQECAIIGESVLGKERLDINEKECDESKGCICDICGQVFITNSLLIRHHKSEHPGMKAFKCNVCEKFFSRIQNLRKHSEVHPVQNPLESDVCSDQFSQPVVHYEQQSMRSVDKPFKCDICRKFFSRKYNLKIHRRIHFRERPHKCLFCERSYSDSSSLRKHEKTHSEEVPFKCYTCQAGFHSKCTLDFHVRTHAV